MLAFIVGLVIGANVGVIIMGSSRPQGNRPRQRSAKLAAATANDL